MKKEKTFKTLNGETQEYDVWKMSDAKDIKEEEGQERLNLDKMSETCEDQLRRMCKEIAEEITSGKTTRLSNYDSKCEVILEAERFMESVYDITWITNQDHKYQGAKLLVAGGGPNIWVNMNTHEVEGYWWGDRVIEPFVDNLQLDEYLEELHANK